MKPFIIEVATARGWSLRYLTELAGINYTGTRDWLAGLPQRLSQEKIQQLYATLQLNAEGRLADNGVYTWSVAIDNVPMQALNNVLKASLQHSDDFFVATPLISADKYFVAPYWLLHYQSIYILIRWRKNKYQLTKSQPLNALAGAGEGVSQSAKTYTPGSAPVKKLYPTLACFDCVKWATGAEIGPACISGIQLSPSQKELLDADIPLGIHTIKEWLSLPNTPLLIDAAPAAPTTWEEVLQRLKLKYPNPAVAAKKLKL